MNGKAKRLRPYDGVRDGDSFPLDITIRSMSLRLDKEGKPSSLDEATRSVEVVCSTESPVEIFDWERWEIVPEVLLMSGCQIPATRQVPLLDTHVRSGVASVFGSCRELRVVGKELLGRAVYSEDAEADKAWRKTVEGHLTDYSVGYRVLEAYYVPEGEKQTIAGRTFEGPVKVATKWKVRELSTCPIGADEMAKARAATPDQRRTSTQEEEKDMNGKLRKFLESRGLATTATEEEAWRFLNTLEIRKDGELPAGLTEADLVRAVPAAPALTADDVKRQAEEMTRAEINRREEIRTMCDFFGFGDMARELIDGNKSVDEARAAILAKQMKEAPAPAARLTLVADERDKFRSAAEGSLILRAGLKHDPAKLAVGAHDLRGYSLRELARECLRMAGQQTGGDPMQMVGRALTSSDFPILLGNTANLALLAGWEQAEESWEKWADGSGSVSDFKTQTLARAGEVDDLDEIGEDDEYKYGAGGEQSESFKIATYGKLAKISRQAIINDELGSISDAFARRGEAAARKIGDIVYAVLVANSAMGDGTALFHADHGNLGTAGAISENTMAEIVKKMGLQKDVRGKRRLNLSPRYIIAPKTAEGYAEIFFNSMMFANDNKGATRANPYAGPKFERIYEARLDDASTTAWYAAAMKGKTVKVFFLNGNRTPYLETRDGWTVDGVEFKTRIDAGAKAMDWRGLAKNAGA